MGIDEHENNSNYDLLKSLHLIMKGRRFLRTKKKQAICRNIGHFGSKGMLCTFVILSCHFSIVTCFSFLPCRTLIWTRPIHSIKANPCYSSQNDEPEFNDNNDDKLYMGDINPRDDDKTTISNFASQNGESTVGDDNWVNDGNDDIDEGKFQIATGISDSTPDSSDQEDMPSTVRLQIQQQQDQIDMLIEMMKNQSAVKDKQPVGVEEVGVEENIKTPRLPSIETPGANTYLPDPLPGVFNDEGEDEISGVDDSLPSTSLMKASSKELLPKSTAMPLTPLKAMLFIDGTWLYYSLYRRKEQEDPILKKFGRGWQHRYRFDWSALPRIICEQIAGQESNMSWTSTGTQGLDGVQPKSTQRPIEIVRAPVFTSYKKSTDPNSFRVKMFNEMADANYDIHMLESVGNGPEKCVDISLAVEMLHYATVPNAYDVAIILSGDKDFIPALVRTRQKGRKVGIASMHTGCNRALHDSPHVKDYDVVWIDDLLDELIVPLSPEEVGKRVESIYDRGLLSAYTISKVILTFLNKSPKGTVSSRDVGRYLKGLQIMDGTTLLDDLKLGRGGLRRFLQEQMPLVFTVTDPSQAEMYNRDSNDKSYWISNTDKATYILNRDLKATSFSTEEKRFLDDFESGNVGGDINEKSYYHTNGGLGSPGLDIPNAKGSKTEVIDLNNLPPDLVEDYTTFTVVRLKERCRERGIPVTGTKAILLGRVQEDVANQTSQLKDQVNQAVDQKASAKRTTLKDKISSQVTRHIEDLIKYYISQMGGEVSSRDLGRFLAANVAYMPGSGGKKITALQELKENFGNLASFFEYKNKVFELSDIGDTFEFGFGIKLKQSTLPPQNISGSPSREEQAYPSVALYLESLVKEYIAASGGHAMSRNLGRYLAANVGLGGTKQTALKQLKNEFGSLANFLQQRQDVFSLIKDDSHKDSNVSLPPATYNFDVTLKNPD